jgi:hypothetical protein
MDDRMDDWMDNWMDNSTAAGDAPSVVTRQEVQ